MAVGLKKMGKPSPVKWAWLAANPMAAMGIAQAGASILGGLIGGGARRREQRQAREAMEKSRAAYMQQEYVNPYANLENPYEDLTVNQQQAQFQGQQMDAQRANIMRGLKGAAGASGIASLAQAMANQGQLQTQRISASIGQQEARNQMLMAKGASAADMAERGGEQWLQSAELDKTATLLSMAYGEATGANVAVQTAKANQMNAKIAQQQIQADAFGTVAQGVAGHDWSQYKKDD